MYADMRDTGLTGNYINEFSSSPQRNDVSLNRANSIGSSNAMVVDFRLRGETDDESMNIHIAAERAIVIAGNNMK